MATRVAWAAALLALLPSGSDPLAAEVSCRRFDTSEFPRLGGLGGAWLSSSQVALTDVKEHRFLIYDLDGDTVRSVDPSVEGHDPQQVVGLTSSGGQLIMTGLPRDQSQYLVGASLLRLNSDLKAVDAYSWPSEWGEDVHIREGGSSGRPTMAEEIRGTQDGFVTWIYFGDRRGIMRFALPAGDRNGVVTPDGFWPEMETEAHPVVPIFSSRLAATTGRDADAYALRVDEGQPFIQRLSGSGERLGVFPDWPDPMPDLPPVSAMGHYPAWWEAVENASFPASLYAEGPYLYVLVRLASEDGPEWELHTVDPAAESLLHRVRLPTRAAHVSLVPGLRHWALLEASSYAEDTLRMPQRLLILSAEAIRNGEELSCG